METTTVAPVAIPRKAVLKQLKADLIGKDSHRGITLTYAWLANQMGHLSLGFIPVIILFIFLSREMAKERAALWSAGIIASVWVLFEAYNFLGPLLMKKPSSSKRMFLPKGSKYTFAPAWGNIAFDTITDVIFFSFGAFAASLCCVYTQSAMIVLMLLLALLIYPASYWYMTKMYLQLPQYPFQFRLSQWEMGITEENRQVVRDFMDNSGPCKHLLVFGAKGTGKTTLSVGIATEMSIKRHAAVYLTAMKLYCMFFDGPAGNLDEIWNWRNASVLVIDDINPGSPIEPDIISPKTFLHMVDTFAHNETNRQALKSRKVIWVLGNSVPKEKDEERWENMLEKIGVQKEHILSVNLSA
ncbi:AAA family ATPase [uncultured Chitinophaga sp.]|uniref:AAA family ATPase n=1 Tax=uncultured Chitinophaga sp. TaxID=339340 RepID=UPI0025DA38F9|nr:AAA family ATPase [uncultured Chitinophaga sp.]